MDEKRIGFADQASLGKSASWRFGVAFFLILGITLLLVRLVGFLLEQTGHDDALLLLTGRLGNPPGPVVTAFAFGFLMFSIIAMLPLMRIILPWIHARPWHSFLTAKPRFDWRLFARSLGAVLVLSALSLILTLTVSPKELQFTANLHAVALFAPLALICLPLQSLTEEILFRGYLAQLVGRFTRWMPVRLLVPALLFTAAHSSNPEALYNFLWAIANYLLLALYLGWISLKGEGLEASFGAHLGINLFAALVVGSSVSVSPGPTLWVSGPPDFKTSLWQTALFLVLHYLLVFRGRPRSNS